MRQLLSGIWKIHTGSTFAGKYDHRMRRNYLKGVSGDKINTVLAAAAYNMMNPTNLNNFKLNVQIVSGIDQTIKNQIKYLIKWMRLKQKEIFDFIFWLIYWPYYLFPARIPSWKF